MSCADPELAPSAAGLLTDRDELTPEDLSFEESGQMVAESFALLLELNGPEALPEALIGVERPDLPELIATAEAAGLDAETLAVFREFATSVRKG